MIPDNPSTSADDADVTITANISDVRAGGATGADYNPNGSGSDMTVAPGLRITDSRNGASRAEPGTLTELRFNVPVHCTTTSDTTIGASCGANTSADALAPGTIVEGKKTVMQVHRMRVEDAGPNGTRGDGDDQLFAQQGYYVP